jgi:hypothetical protein
MFDGITYVDPNHDPIIHEGEDAATVIVMNAGPCTVELRGWRQAQADGEPYIRTRLWPGNTKSVNAHLIRAHSTEDGPDITGRRYAAIGWRIAS